MLNRFKLNILRLCYSYLYRKYKVYTMIPKDVFISNLELVRSFKNIKGDVVECGVWRGGMIASISNIMGSDREYHLFDSFEGLPDAQDIDGEAAIKWQEDKHLSTYYDNCKAETKWAEEAMNRTQVHYVLHKGWFCDTLKNYTKGEGIAILRMDGDWYDSTLDILNHLFEKVNKNGIIIIDDYYSWDGCSRAVHDFLSQNKLPNRVRQYNNKVAYIVK
jgi:O-methyltransferase